MQLFKSKLGAVKHLLGKGEGRNIRRWKFTRCEFSALDQNLVQEADQLDVFLLLAHYFWGQDLFLKTRLSQFEDLFFFLPLEARNI